MRKFNLYVLAIAALMSGSISQASVMVVEGNTSDASTTSTGVVERSTSADWRIGGSAAGITSSFVYVFELPEIPAGESIVDADLQATLISTNDWKSLKEKGLDVYGVRVSDSSAVLSTDYFSGVYADSGNNGTGIQQNFVYQPNEYNGGTDPLLVGAHNTDDAGDSNLANWLQGLYDGGAQAGDFAFIRLNTDGTLGDYRYFVMATANNGTAENRPVLTITSDVPEPASMGLLVLGAMAMIRRR